LDSDRVTIGQYVGFVRMVGGNCCTSFLLGWVRLAIRIVILSNGTSDCATVLFIYPMSTDADRWNCLFGGMGSVD